MTTYTPYQVFSIAPCLLLIANGLFETDAGGIIQKLWETGMCPFANISLRIKPLIVTLRLLSYGLCRLLVILKRLCSKQRGTRSD